MAEPEIVVCKDSADLAGRAAERFAGAAAAAAGRFAVALSGGTTPAEFYARLGMEGSGRIAWRSVHLFWGDERCVPPDHPQSNYRTARESLISKIPVPPANVHRMAGEEEPSAAAAAYERELRGFFRPPPGQPPRFDLIFLGVGEDGHIASLFPGSAALREAERWVLSTFVESAGAHRLTLTLPVINGAARVIFLVKGASKAEIVGRVLGARRGSPDLPAALVRPRHGSVTWLVTRDAARRLVCVGG
ncbi:MAG TPA: 6-phosphogluconolactonase [candidate division Zixibacteria bacterium]|nr:6-phosphogluconolactonase [candidate division Zixibacteria bacterium]